MGQSYIRHLSQVGVTSSLQGAVEFWLWTQSLHMEPTREAIQAHYGCSRATAYRYLNAYRNVVSRFRSRSTECINTREALQSAVDRTDVALARCKGDVT